MTPLDLAVDYGLIRVSKVHKIVMLKTNVEIIVAGF